MKLRTFAAGNVGLVDKPDFKVRSAERCSTHRDFGCVLFKAVE